MQVSGDGEQLVSKGVVEPRDTKGKAAKSLRMVRSSQSYQWDHCFVGARNRTSDAEVEQRGDSPVLVMHDGVTKSIFAHLIPAKAVDFPCCDKVVKMIVQRFGDTLGYHSVVFRCDNEPSILSLLRTVKMAWTGDAVQERPLKATQQSNGAAESSVNVVKGHVRSIKLAVESASSVEVPADHDLLTWLVPYAASMHRRFAVGRDGKTAYERNVGRRAVHPLAQFGERVWWMPTACSHPTAVWALWIHDLNKEGTWDRWMDRTRYLLAPQVEW